MDQYYIFILLAPIAAIITLLIAIYAWRHRTVPGAFMLFLGLLAITGWLTSNSFELISTTDQATIFSAKISYLFFLSAPIFYLGFILQYTGKQKWLSYSRFVLFWILPAITFILVQTNEMHGLIWSSYSIVQVNQTLQILRVSSYGSWFWVNAGYTYIIIITGAIVIGNQYFRSLAPYRQQSKWLILGSVTPLIFNFVYILHLIPTLKKDYSPLAFAFAGLAYAIGIFRHRLLDIMPIARDTILENIQEGLIVLDQERRMIDINPAARSFLFPFSNEIIGVPLKESFPETAHLFSKDKQQSQVIELSIQRDKAKKQLEAKLSILKNKKGKEMGYLLILQDITERHKLYQEIKHLARTDSLTNLNNRRHLFTLGEKEIIRANRYKHPISLLIIDIDHFKEINDSYGHLSGDQILEQFSFTLQNSLRSIDIIGRYGGDEFAVVLPETHPNSAKSVANRICQITKNRVWCTTAGEIIFTLSIGISGETEVKNNTNLNSLLDRADRALYLAKSRGRNQVALEK